MTLIIKQQVCNQHYPKVQLVDSFWFSGYNAFKWASSVLKLPYYSIRNNFSHKRLGNIGRLALETHGGIIIQTAEPMALPPCPIRTETILGLKETKGKFSLTQLKSNLGYSRATWGDNSIYYPSMPVISQLLSFKTHWTIEHNAREWRCKDEHKWLLQQGACGKTEKTGTLSVSK